MAVLFAGLWAPVAAQEGIGLDATPSAPIETPAVTPDVTEEPPTEPASETPVVTEMPATETPIATEVAPEETPVPTAVTPDVTPASKAAPNAAVAAVGDVNFSVTTADGGPIPSTFRLCVWDPVNLTQCSDPAVASWEVGVPAGEFDYWTELQDPYLEIDVYDVAVAAGESLQIGVVLELAQMVDVTFNVATSDGGDIPADLEICVSDAVNFVTCSGSGVTSWTVEVLSQRFGYWTHFTAPYIDVDVEDVSLPAGEPATIDIVLEPEPELETNITKVVSDSNPAPGTEITYTIHAWGMSPHNAVSIEDFLPRELTNVSFSCDIAAGTPQWSDSCDDWWMPDLGFIYGGVDPDDQGNYDVTLLVTATVPEEPGIHIVNTACAFGERDVLSAQRDVAADPIAGSECAAVSVLTQMETQEASVTVNVTTDDASPLPVGTTICVTSPAMVEPECANADASSATFPVAAGPFLYRVLAPGYTPAAGFGEVEAGGNAVIDVMLASGTESDMHITKTASETNPAPGARIMYEIHVWGTTTSLEPIQFVDVLPAELTDVRVSCEIITGFTFDHSCAYPLDGTIVGSIMPDDHNDNSDEYEMVVTVMGTVTDAPGVEFTNLACISTFVGERGPGGPLTGRTGVQAFAQVLPPVSEIDGACDAATVMTQEAPEPDAGTWGEATMSVDVADAAPGDVVTYTLTLPWMAAPDAMIPLSTQGFAAAQAVPASFFISDPVPQTLTNVSWTCEGVNAACSPANGSGYDVTAEGMVTDPSADALVTLTITGTVRDDAPAGEVVNEACVDHDVPPAPMLGFLQQACVQSPMARFNVLAQPVDPTPEPTGTVVPTDTPSVTPTATATPDGTPVVSMLPKTGAAPGQGASSLGLIALIAAMSLGAGALAVRGTRLRR